MMGGGGARPGRRVFQAEKTLSSNALSQTVFASLSWEPGVIENRAMQGEGKRSDGSKRQAVEGLRGHSKVMDCAPPGETGSLGGAPAGGSIWLPELKDCSGCGVEERRQEGIDLGGNRETFTDAIAVISGRGGSG